MTKTACSPLTPFAPRERGPASRRVRGVPAVLIVLALGSLAFASPWLLVALAALPIIWWLLRVTPPAPRRIAFPAIRLLLGLVPREETPAHTPLWLILLAHGARRAGDFRGRPPAAQSTGAPRLDRPDPRDRRRRLGCAARLAGPAGGAHRPFGRGRARGPASRSRHHRPACNKRAVGAVGADPRRRRARRQCRHCSPSRGRSTGGPRWRGSKHCLCAEADSAVWLSDGVADGESEALAAYLAARGSLRYVAAEPDQAPLLLAAGDTQANDLGVVLRSLPAPAPRLYQVRASAEDGRLLARQAATIEPGAKAVEVRLPMPSELRNRTARIEVEGDQSAGSVLLVDERWRRRPVGIAAAANAGSQPLLSENYYLERALDPFAEIRRGRATDLLKRELAVLIFSDTGPDSPVEEAAVAKWIEAGGLLLRFAGPHLAEQGDQLLPVRLRRGGRTIGGALSWEQPARLAPFEPDSPFAGLPVPADVTISRQVLAEPDLDLANKTWARLADGTPLVTAEKRGQGWIVLVHTTANAEWSNLALSGLFVEMLRRTVAMSQGVAARKRGGAAADRDARRVRPVAARPADRSPDLRQGGGIGQAHPRSTRPASTARRTPSARSTCRPESRN